MARQKTTPYLTTIQMEQLITPRLLAYYKSLLKAPPMGIKESQDWILAKARCKMILDTREHVPKD